MQELEQGAEPASVAETPAILGRFSCSGSAGGRGRARVERVWRWWRRRFAFSADRRTPPPFRPRPFRPRQHPARCRLRRGIVVPATDAEAARFVLQAQFSVSDADITSLKSGGVLAWLNARYDEPLGQTGVAWLDSRGHNAITDRKSVTTRSRVRRLHDLESAARGSGPDAQAHGARIVGNVRRVLEPLNFPLSSYLIAAYWDVLTANAFGNFRQLLEALTLNAAMGFFLSTRGNLRENSRGRQPDENYAREVMQLFTIGLYELNPDGTHKLDADNKPVETFGQEDVMNLARVFTGYDWDYLSNGGTSTPVAWEETRIPSTHFATNPMRFTPTSIRPWR